MDLLLLVKLASYPLGFASLGTYVLSIGETKTPQLRKAKIVGLVAGMALQAPLGFGNLLVTPGYLPLNALTVGANLLALAKLDALPPRLNASILRLHARFWKTVKKWRRRKQGEQGK